MGEELQAMSLTAHWRNSAVKRKKEMGSSWRVKWDHEKVVFILQWEKKWYFVC